MARRKFQGYDEDAFQAALDRGTRLLSELEVPQEARDALIPELDVGALPGDEQVRERLQHGGKQEVQDIARSRMAHGLQNEPKLAGQPLRYEPSRTQRYVLDPIADLLRGLDPTSRERNPAPVPLATPAAGPAIEQTPSVPRPSVLPDPAQEQSFQAWYRDYAKAQGLNADPDAPQHQYDYRSAWQEQQRTGDVFRPDPGDRDPVTMQPRLHGDSRFKTEGHPRRFVETPEGTLDTKYGITVPKPSPTALPNRPSAESPSVSTVHDITQPSRDLEARPGERARLPSTRLPGAAPIEQPDVLMPAIAPRLAPPAVPTPTMTAGEAFTQASNNFMQGLADIPASSLKAVSIAAQQLDDVIGLNQGKKLEDYAFHRAGSIVDRLAKEMFPTDPAKQHDFLLSVVPRAFGSMVGFLAGGAVAGIAKGSLPAASALLGAGTQGAQQFEEAQQFKADRTTQKQAFWLGAILGTTEALPIAAMLDRVNKASGGTLRNILKNGGITAAQEFLQEWGQQVGSNAVALALYDENRGLFEQAGISGAAGGITGMVTGLLAGALGARKTKQASDSKAPLTDKLEGEKAPTSGAEGIPTPKAGRTPIDQPPAEYVKPKLQREAEQVQQAIPDELAIQPREPFLVKRPDSRPSLPASEPLPEVASQPPGGEIAPPEPVSAPKQALPVPGAGPAEPRPAAVQFAGIQPGFGKTPDFELLTPKSTYSRQTLEQAGILVPPAPQQAFSTQPPDTLVPREGVRAKSQEPMPPPVEPLQPVPVPPIGPPQVKADSTLDTGRLNQVATQLGKSGGEEGRRFASEIADALRILKAGETEAALERLKGIENNLYAKWPALSEVIGEIVGQGERKEKPLEPEVLSPVGPVRQAEEPPMYAGAPGAEAHRSGQGTWSEKWEYDPGAMPGEVLAWMGRFTRPKAVIIEEDTDAKPFVLQFPGQKEPKGGWPRFHDTEQAEQFAIEFLRKVIPAKATTVEPIGEIAPREEVKALPEKASREPWQMTQAEWFDHKWQQVPRKAQKQIMAGAPGVVGIEKIRQQSDGEHRRNIERAITAGKPVPAEVLADYPDLQPEKTSLAPKPTKALPAGDLVIKPMFGGPEEIIPAERLAGSKVAGGIPTPKVEAGFDPAAKAKLQADERTQAAEIKRVFDENMKTFEKPEAKRPTDKANASEAVADWVTKMLKGETIITKEMLTAQADQTFGGTRAQGTYTAKDMFDALELGINKFIESHGQGFSFIPTGPVKTAKETVKALRTLVMDRIPSQMGLRSEEMVEFQQFSTPPDLAFVMAWAAHIHAKSPTGTEAAWPQDVILEPSAGLGGLAIFAKLAGAKVLVNEFSERRAALLKTLGFDRVFQENAEQLDNVLPDDVKPTVVLMNPPFSSTAGRMEGKRVSANILDHINQAMNRLQPGGRAVVLMGEPMFKDKGFAEPVRKGLEKLAKENTLQASIRVEGAFKKYGTTYATRILIYDKMKPSPEHRLVTGSVEDVVDALPLLQEVRDARKRPAEDRGRAEQTAAPSNRPPVAEGGEGRTSPRQPVSAPTDAVGPRGQRPDVPQGQQPERAPTGRRGQPAGEPQPGGRPSVRGGQGLPAVAESGAGEGRGGSRVESPGRPGEPTGQRSEPASKLTLEQPTEETKPTGPVTALTESIFESYTPKKARIAGAKPHPGKLVESAAMSAVAPPDASYQPHLPKKMITDGKVSDAQVEVVIYAGQAHQKILPTGQRKGFFVGDGTGVGKGREIAAVIFDNFAQGRTKAIWVTKNHKLMRSAVRDWTDIGGDKDLLFDVGKNKLDKDLTESKGIGFATYGLLRTGIQLAPSGNIEKAKDKKTGQAIRQSRLEQMVHWLGQDFDGLIVFDESHQMRKNNAGKGQHGITKPSLQAMAGLELQKVLPKARILYASATGGIEVSDFGYAERLGLWGEGTPFANKAMFNGAIESGGLAAMEVVAQDLKANGLYVARSLAYDEVTYERLTHNLTDEQKTIFNTMARSWQTVLQNLNAAMEATKASKNGNAKSAAKSKFWGAHQRFFNQILTAMEMPSVLTKMKADLERGESVVIQLVNTNEATQNRQIEKAEQEEGSLEDLDLTPRENLMQYLDHAFPTQQFEEFADDNGHIRSRPVHAADGTPVQNKSAVRMKQDLMERLGSLKVPDGPLEYLLNTFGEDQVAEVTGRSQRVVRNKDGDTVIQRRSESIAAKDAELFMADKKPILVFSDAGGTGESYHADLTKKNQRKRNHYVVQPGWRADAAMQGLGRTHRTNQKQAPHYVLASTDLNGHKRFISTIARRLSQLGALTRGQRQTTSQGLFSEKDNLENRYAHGAITSFFQDLARGQIKDMAFQELITKLGFENVLDQAGNLNAQAIPEVPQFLNRILSLEFDEQNAVFDAFYERMARAIDAAMEAGTFETGLENYKADSVTVTKSQTVHTDKDTGATVRLVEFEVHNKVTFRPAKEISKREGFLSFVTNNKTGHVYAAFKATTKTNEQGVVVQQYRLAAPEVGRTQYVDEAHYLERYTKIDKDEAADKWQAHIKSAKQMTDETLYLLEGALLKIWDRLPTATSRVYRVQTDEGKRHVGRAVHEEEVADTLERLGVAAEQKTYTPEQVASRILEQKAEAVLANGWKIKRVTIGGDPRIELIGGNFGLTNFHRELTTAGAFTEIIQYKTRWFIPTDRAAEVLEKILKSRPVVKLIGGIKRAGAILEEERGSIPLGRAAAAPNVIRGLEDATDGKFHSENPDVDARVQTAKAGLQKEGWTEKFKAALAQMHKMSREFEHLPDTAVFSPLRTALLKLQKQKGVTADRTVRRLSEIIKGLGAAKEDLFAWKVLLDDLAHEAEAERNLPFGYTAGQVIDDQAAVDRLLGQNPDVAERIAQRKAAWDQLKRRYIAAMEAIGFDKAKERLTKEDYFRHQVLEYAQDKGRAVQGTGQRLRSPTGRGFLKQREGSTLDINANYLQAEFEVMAQMEYDIEVAKVIRLVDQTYNIRTRLEQEARALNNERLQQKIEAGDVMVDAQMQDFRQRIAIGISKVKKALGLAKDATVSMDELQRMAKDADDPGHAGALQVFKAISERKAFVKETLGAEYVTWEQVVPEGYTVWQPEQGNIFFLAKTLPARLIQTIHEQMAEAISIQPEQLRSLLAMGGPKEQYVVPQEVADTLNSMTRPVPDWWKESSAQLLGHWKQLVLLAPRRAIKYNLRNLTGDADALFVGNPHAFTKARQALHDLWPVFMKQGGPIEGEAKEWFDRGGFQSTLQVQELGDLNDLRIFRAALEREDKGGLTKIPLTIFNKYWQTARLATDLRESILRYAAYLDYLEQIKADPQGRPNSFGASIPENVLALPDSRDRAYKLANELLGAYDRVSVTGQTLRRHWWPFWSWQEVNFRRYKQLTKNALWDVDAGQLARLGAVGGTRAGLKAVKWGIRFAAVWAILQFWNHLFFPDEERELDATTKNRPHIIFGRDDKGKILYLAGLGALGDVLNWFGLDVAPQLTGDVLHGRLSMGEAVKQMAKAPINKIVQGITPVIKMPAELLSRESFYPDVFRPRAIQDRWDYVAQQFTVGPEFRKLTNRPGPGYLSAEDVGSLFMQRQDPGAAAYADWSAIEERWRHRFGKEQGIYFKTPKGLALRNLIRAKQEDDTEAAGRAWEQYKKLGGSEKAMEQSLRNQAPLSGLTKPERDTMLKGLDGEEMEILHRAERYYKDVMLKALEPKHRAAFIRKLEGQKWLSREAGGLPVPAQANATSGKDALRQIGLAP